MDAEGTIALYHLCLAQVCRSLDTLCSSRADGSLHLTCAPLLPPEIADQLLQKMAAEGLLNDRTVGIFRNRKELRLRQASIRGCPMSVEAFRLAICPHRLQELDASWLPEGITGADIISGLASNPECRTSLQKLSLTGLHLDWNSLRPGGGGGPVGLSALRGLRTLQLANTDLTDAALEEICSLPRLESLDISCCGVSDLAALLECRATLRSLSAHGLRRLDTPPTGLFSVLSQLQALRHLDLSGDHFAVASLDEGDGQEVADEALRKILGGSPWVLPNLLSLDVSGRKRITAGALKAFVEARGGLVFLGLLATGLAACDFLSSRTNIQVTGDANEKQVCEALRRYRERECYVREALLHLYNLTTDVSKPRPDILKLVLGGMRSHTASLHVQLGALACVFNLTTQDMAQAMPVHLLTAALNQLLLAMQRFPQHMQVQKNCLLTLCSDFILQEIPFDKYLAARLVMNWLSISNHEAEPALQRMAVAIISILVAKLSTEETTQFATDINIMMQLLAIVQQRATMGTVDNTLKFALSALWNLTDETPIAARLFIKCLGLELYEEVLESYTESSVQQKVLGLLNNLAEVEEVQDELMEEDLLESILSLLWDPQVEVKVRYFAGGILAQLASRPQAWTLDKELWDTILKKLHATIMTWTEPDREIVSYRTFNPFLPLLRTSQPTGVQLWAVWAIHLVSSQNANYCSMLQREGVVHLLEALATHPDVHSDVRGLAELILNIVGQQPGHAEPQGH